MWVCGTAGLRIEKLLDADDDDLPISHFRSINSHLDSEAERTKTIETSCNECERY